MTDQSVAIVTGAASGIGLAIARAASTMYDVVVLADLDGDRLTAAIADGAPGGARLIAHPLDLRDAAAVDGLAAAAASYGSVAFAALNAGVTASGPPLWETPSDTLRFMLDVNVIGTANSIRSIVPLLVGRPQPSAVVITGSMAGLVSSPHSGAYAASKAATIAFAKSLRSELTSAAPQVSVTVCCPGMVQTNLMKTSLQASPEVMSADLVAAAHDALNTYGIPADEQARLIFEAVAEGRFWALPPAGDPFVDQLQGEAEELKGVLG